MVLPLVIPRVARGGYQPAARQRHRHPGWRPLGSAEVACATGQSRLGGELRTAHGMLKAQTARLARDGLPNPEIGARLTPPHPARSLRRRAAALTRRASRSAAQPRLAGCAGHLSGSERARPG